VPRQLEQRQAAAAPSGADLEQPQAPVSGSRETAAIAATRLLTA
jgi:hypothetical protein